MPLIIRHIPAILGNITNIQEVPCDICESTPVQEIPVEQNIGEAYSLYICKQCLLTLAAELPE